ncbi:MAG TPA: ABC transporter permease [Ectothiorhodospiraceae bacterium]|nr:ABC transporter permease [Ectothiorhodospiraceae bacterium]
MMRRFLTVLHARNIEFVRDRSALSWGILFPLLLMLGFALIFDAGDQNLYKVGVIGEGQHSFLESRYIQFIPFDDQSSAIIKVERHQLDLLLNLPQQRYWINSTSPKGYVVEKMLSASGDTPLQQAVVTGKEIRYIDWLIPGVLGMNMMFSALFGIGFVIVRYRKNGVLKRLKGTPLSATEFLLAQIVSRLLLIILVSTLVFIVCDLILDFAMFGSYWLLFAVLILGALSLISMGLLVAARLKSDEVASGVANAISMPMMLLSGVWFSLEGAPEWIIAFAKLLPLTHVVEAARAIMLDGAGIAEIGLQLITLAIMTLLFLFIGVKLFRWD